MISTNDFKTGMTIDYEGNLFQVIEFQHVKPGKGQAFVRSKLRNLRTGAVIDNTFNAGEKVKRAHIEKATMHTIQITSTFRIDISFLIITFIKKLSMLCSPFSP